MSAHTPGPWQAIAWACHGPTTIVSDHGRTRTVIAECSGNGRSAEECVADARLIAAATELLAELKSARAVLRTAEHDIADPLGKEVIERRLKMMSAVIAKAEAA